MPTASRSSRRLHWLIALICVVALPVLEYGLVGPVRIAHAQPDSDSGKKKSSSKKAKKHFRQGQRMFAMGRFRKALASYEKAYSLSKHPDILFNIAQCYRNLGDYESAIYHFETYLEKKPEADNREAVLELIDKLDAEMAEADKLRDKDKDRDKDRDKDKDKVDPDRDPDKNPARTKKRRKSRTKKSGPFYTRWWFWTGLVVVAGGATGTGLYLRSREGGIPDSTLGNVVFPQ